ncbi:MAG: hypothetical protein NTX04_08660 [Verrucomicrobia bacterium]|nr:hypothetical protein [Verrucomicrobiota bacterium]
MVVIAGMAAVDLVADLGAASLLAVWVSEASFWLPIEMGVAADAERRRF